MLYYKATQAAIQIGTGWQQAEKHRYNKLRSIAVTPPVSDAHMSQAMTLIPWELFWTQMILVVLSTRVISKVAEVMLSPLNF